MKRMFLAGFLFLVSCTPMTRFMTPDYEGKRLVGGSMAITPFSEGALFIENTDDVKDDLGAGEARAVFTAFFDSHMTVAARRFSMLKTVRIAPFKNKLEMERTTFTIGKDKTMEIALPAEGQIVEFDSTYDYVLLIGRLDVARYAGQAGSWMPGPGGGTFAGGKSAALVYTTTYAIWDNKVGKVISYGQFSADASFAFAMTKGTWESAINNLAHMIFEKSPFYRMMAYQ